jgi:hypothetical protein
MNSNLNPMVGELQYYDILNKIIRLELLYNVTNKNNV